MTSVALWVAVIIAVLVAHICAVTVLVWVAARITGTKSEERDRD